MELHWLPIRSRILFRILGLTYKSLLGMAPLIYGSNEVKYLLAIPRTNLCSSGDRALAAASPQEWNKLPLAIQSLETLDIFKSKLKTFLLANCYF